VSPQSRIAHQVVADRYELLEPVGRGGFGVVWRALDTLLERQVAVKEIHIPGFLSEQDRADLRSKVLKEAQAEARLDHPGAVTVYDVIDDDDGHPVIVMELVDAPTLAELVASRGPLPPDEVARIGAQVLEVLVAAHAHGIVHRDVKPANVMVGDAGRVRLGDFGVAAMLDDPTVSTSAAVTGSPAYMAPEQATKKGAVPESDLWSLGATMYFAVEGRPPSDKGAPLPTLTSIVQDPPRPAERAGALAPVLVELLVKDPAARLSEAALRDRLTDVATPTPAPSPSPSPTLLSPAGGFSDDTTVIHLDEPIARAPEPVPDAPPAVPTAPGPPSPPVAPPPAAPPPRPAVAATPHRPGRGWALVGAVGVVVLALIGIALASRGSKSPSSTAASPATTVTTATSKSGGSPATTAPAKKGGTPAASDTVAYADPQTGFTINAPKGWAVRTDGTLTDFRDPDSGAYLRVDHIQPPGPSPEGAWVELEKSFSAENANYQRIRIEPTTYAGYRAAVWEFTYSGGGADLHVADLGFITPHYGFALYFQTRSADWDRLQPTLQAFKDSFKAPA
jgi:serine/threonine protein kinase